MNTENKKLGSVFFTSNYNNECHIVNEESEYKYNELNFSNSNKIFLTLRIFSECIKQCDAFIDVLKKEKEDNDIKLDIIVSKKSYYRIYGCAIDQNNVSYKDVLVRLFKYDIASSSIKRNEIQSMFTNSYGEFNFVVYTDNDIKSYNVEIDQSYVEF